MASGMAGLVAAPGPNVFPVLKTGRRERGSPGPHRDDTGPQLGGDAAMSQAVGGQEQQRLGSAGSADGGRLGPSHPVQDLPLAGLEERIRTITRQLFARHYT